MKWFFSIVIFFIFFLAVAYPLKAETGYATCDLCGMCQKNGEIAPTPQSWEKCRQCLYPDDTTGDPLYTLAIDPVTNVAPTQYPGHLYTMIGCIQSNISFTNDGAATSVVNLILSYIFRFAGGLAFLYLLYGSYIILTSRSEPEKLDYGKRIVWSAIVGLLFCLFAVFIVNLLANGVLRLPGFSTTPTPTP